ncbi:hypothetical protein [Methanococcoides methylutens]|nr:hypothetical protein [Methanococcoides methylutens]
MISKNFEKNLVKNLNLLSIWRRSPVHQKCVLAEAAIGDIA